VEYAYNLPEFSEKMIQRELAALVQEGVVMKQGEKRWSRYSLK
jgi:DNA-binding HxlR family transcriptional regulator